MKQTLRLTTPPTEGDPTPNNDRRQLWSHNEGWQLGVRCIVRVAVTHLVRRVTRWQASSITWRALTPTWLAFNQEWGVFVEWVHAHSRIVANVIVRVEYLHVTSWQGLKVNDYKPWMCNTTHSKRNKDSVNTKERNIRQHTVSIVYI